MQKPTEKPLNVCRVFLYSQSLKLKHKNYPSHTGYLISFSNDNNHCSDFMERNWRPENGAMYMYIPSRFHIVFKVQLKL